jgi:predicted HicB family RNase H-like nuclease
LGAVVVYNSLATQLLQFQSKSIEGVQEKLLSSMSVEYFSATLACLRGEWGEQRRPIAESFFVRVFEGLGRCAASGAEQ